MAQTGKDFAMHSIGARHKTFAIKVPNLATPARDTQEEIRILTALKRGDPDETQPVRHMVGHRPVVWCDKACVVLGLGGSTLLDVSKGYGKRSLPDLERVASDLLTALAFLHDTVGAVHSDVKPENIIYCGGIERNKNRGGVLLSDFGNAVLLTDPLKRDFLITSRPYRSPEVILKKSWDTRVDIRSLGCVLWEFWSGTMFVPPSVDDDGLHLRIIRHRLGISDRNCENIPSHIVAATPPIRSVRASQPQLHDFITSMLSVDPHHRPSARSLLSHPFLEDSSLDIKSILIREPAWVIVLALEQCTEDRGLYTSIDGTPYGTLASLRPVRMDEQSRRSDHGVEPRHGQGARGEDRRCGVGTV